MHEKGKYDLTLLVFSALGKVIKSGAPFCGDILDKFCINNFLGITLLRMCLQNFVNQDNFAFLIGRALRAKITLP